jgi:hypothetical protein
MLILFGGGDGGGIYIDANGKIHRIPPWDPHVMNELKATNAVLRAAAGLSDKGMVGQLSEFGERLTTATIPELLKSPEVVKSVGQRGVEVGPVAFLDAEDGFVCGSTGKGPGHIPIPHGPAVRETATFAS